MGDLWLANTLVPLGKLGACWGHWWMDTQTSSRGPAGHAFVLRVGGSGAV